MLMTFLLTLPVLFSVVMQPMEMPPAEMVLDSKTQAPRVEEEPQTMEVEEGEPVRFTCRITGKPRKEKEKSII